jgi:tRNA(His) 5'-end guanylyltransferase
MAAQSCYTQQELAGKSGNELHGLLFRKGINWNDYPVRIKRGCFIERKTVVKQVEFVHGRTGELCQAETERHVWDRAEDLPVFTRDPEWLQRRIPVYG